MKVVFNKEQILNFETFLDHEYLLTNGRGGYCSSTLLDCHTRKYHGLLNLPLRHLDARYVLLSKVELSAIIGKNQYDFSVNEFQGNFFPKGFEFTQMIELDYFPTVFYQVEDTIISKSILMPFQAETVLLKYSNLSSKKPVILKLAPFLAYRNIHSLANQNIDIHPRTYFEKNGFKIDPYTNVSPLFLQTSQTSIFFPAPDWWNKFFYRQEKDRGYPYTEDLFCPGIFEVKLKKGESVILRASTTAINRKPDAEWKDEETRIRNMQKKLEKLSTTEKVLNVSSRQYITTDPEGIIAGYPWFGEWGRDTMISLPGCTLAQGNSDTAFKILSAYSAYEKNGLLPNTLSPSGTFGYNTIDTPFLYFQAIQNFFAATGDKKNITKQLLPSMVSILETVIKGKQPFGKIHENGLLYAGNSKTQLTWMDAQTAAGPVTPRYGAAVEINALFYNALCFILEYFADTITSESKTLCSEIREKLEKNFEKLFWNEDKECLFDVFRAENDKDTQLRPNQLFAIGLPFSCISDKNAEKIILTVQKHLVTPVGLRSLSPEDTAYISTYSGDQTKRDNSYHQGIVWPWLIGIYADALLKYSKNTAETKKQLAAQFSILFNEHLRTGCINHISELFDAEEPFAPKGCPAQAWSTAEVFRILTIINKKSSS